jgi:hypothetical protein
VQQTLHNERTGHNDKYYRKQKPENRIRRSDRNMPAQENAWQRTNQQGREDVPIRGAQYPVTNPASERQRHRMSDIGTYDPPHWQMRIKQEKDRDAKGSRPN